jgi:hypothetical protein
VKPYDGYNNSYRKGQKVFYTPKKPRWKRTFVDSMLNALNTVPGAALIGATPKVHLWTGAIAFDSNSALAVFTAAECNFTGYTAPALGVPSGPVNAFTDVRALLGTALFTLTGTAVVQSASGYWVDAGASPDWIVAEAFTSPIPFSSIGDFLDLDLLFSVALMPTVGV